jgi:hypothetical protein
MKKKKKRADGSVTLGAASGIAIIVPDNIVNDLSHGALHGIGRLTYAATSTYGVDDIAIVKGSGLRQLPEEIVVFGIWQKSGSEE